MYTILTTDEFEDWLENQNLKSQTQIENRLNKVREYGHFGVVKNVNDSVWEFKWKNGRRIYYTYIEEFKIILILGGNKNGQSYDIAQAKKILKKNQR